MNLKMEMEKKSYIMMVVHYGVCTVHCSNAFKLAARAFQTRLQFYLKYMSSIDLH